MDFNFRNFSARSFERFAQAMAMHVLGPGVLVFGDGPDGAREATYEGILAYPSAAEHWSGYTVMQAKFLQVPGEPQDDADWLVAQLTAEFNKFIVHDSALRKPDFYILISNARLSPMPSGKRGKGGIAKVDEVFKKYKKKLGLKDYRIWHLDQLSTMLMNATEIRRSYAAWLSTSDVIAELLESMHVKTKAVKEAMYRYLARELRSHQPVRLQQAGYSGGAQTMIEDVFIDLPFRVDDRTKNDESPDKLLLATLLERSRDCLDGASVNAQQKGSVGRPERILMLGGPGQGKSTLSQFLAQIFRANILHLERAGQYPVEVGKVIQNTLAKAESAGLGINVPRRFPLRVDLPNFADWLSGRGGVGQASILHYLAQNISAVADADVEIDSLRHWISSFPSVLILDGFDEVPPSANRGAVLRAIDRFWDEAVNADVLMIVTTRPQGYSDELDPNYYTKYEMTALVPERALAYAKKLADARIFDRINRDRVIGRFEEAAKSNTTARLMVSPLQVAILLALIDQRGDAPTDRWSLFDKYFAVVLQREQAKAGPIGQTMRHWGRQISAIHYKAGFLLHVEAETKGNSEAFLSGSELKGLINAQLSDEEFEGDELDRIAVELLGASTERLVLIVQREDDRFSFEVRSLQEFMAAAYLMTGREAVVQKRLRVISNRTHWLHVFQIASSKCFSVNDSEQYRDTIVTVCRDLNENGEEVDRLLRTGSRLALALLDDGLAYDQPKYRRLLLSAAFDLLSAGPSILPESLCDHCEREPARTIEFLRRYISVKYSEPRLAAWQLVLRCVSMGQTWPLNIFDEYWPENVDEALDLFSNEINFSVVSPLYERFRCAIDAASPVAIRKLVLFGTGNDVNRRRQIEEILNEFPRGYLFDSDRGKRLSVVVNVGGQKTPLTLNFSSIRVEKFRLKAYNDIPDAPGWASHRALRDFHLKPSASTLADLLELIVVEGWQKRFYEMLPSLPWPLETMFAIVEDCGGLQQIAQEVRAGVYGDIDDWLAAEERWLNQGITDADLGLLACGKFFDANVANVGIPLSHGYSIVHFETEREWLDLLLDYGVKSQGLPRRFMRKMLTFALLFYAPNSPVSLDLALYLIGKSDETVAKLEWIRPDVVTRLPLALFDEQGFLKELDRKGKSGEIYFAHETTSGQMIFQKLISNVDEFPGLLVFVANLLFVNDFFDWLKTLDGDKLVSFSKVDSPVVVKYSKLFAILLGVADEDSVKGFLRSVVEVKPSQAKVLLTKLFSVEYLERERGILVAEAMARAINQNPDIEHDWIMNHIQAFANSRHTELRQQDSWRSLELGESLLALAARRQMQAQ